MTSSTHVQGITEIYHQTVEFDKNSSVGFQQETDPNILWYSEDDFGNVIDQLYVDVIIVNTDTPVGVKVNFKKYIYDEIFISISSTVDWLTNGSEVRFTTQFYELWIFEDVFHNNFYNDYGNASQMNTIFVEFYTKAGIWSNNLTAEIILFKGPRTYVSDINNKILISVINPNENENNSVNSPGWIVFTLAITSILHSKILGRRRR